MGTKFTLQIEVVLKEEPAARTIAVAREAYASGSGASALVDGEEHAIPAEQFIGCPEQALMELVEANPLFEKAGIVVDKVSCRRENGPPQQSVGPEEPEVSSDDELDEEDSGLYVCRWPNGDFSVVMADTKPSWPRIAAAARSGRSGCRSLR